MIFTCSLLQKVPLKIKSTKCSLISCIKFAFRRDWILVLHLCRIIISLYMILHHVLEEQYCSSITWCKIMKKNHNLKQKTNKQELSVNNQARRKGKNTLFDDKDKCKVVNHLFTTVIQSCHVSSSAVNQGTIVNFEEFPRWNGRKTVCFPFVSSCNA